MHPPPELIHAYGALKGTPCVVRTVKPFFRLPWGSALCFLREGAEFHKPAGSGGQFGKSVSLEIRDPYNTARQVRFLGPKLSCMCLYQVGKIRGELVSAQGAAKKGRSSQNHKWETERLLRGEHVNTVWTPTEHSFPPSPCREICRDVPVRPQLLSSALLSCKYTGG